LYKDDLRGHIKSELARVLMMRFYNLTDYDVVFIVVNVLYCIFLDADFSRSCFPYI